MSDIAAALPSVPQNMVATPEGLAECCGHLAKMGRFAFDTEFIGESSYQPRLCLIQVATTERVELLDPFAVEDLGPFWRVLADARIQKICHAGEQDLAIAWQRSGLEPANVMDAQIAAGMTGLGYPVAYWRLVELFCGVSLGKAHTFSAWNRRPLTRAQFAYAVDDVRYLPAAYTALEARLKALGHEKWMEKACADECEHAAAGVDPRTIFLRLKGANMLNGPQLAVLRELAALREQLAYEHDVPPRTMLRDDVLLDLATRMPRRERDLQAIRSLPAEEAKSYGDHLLAAVERGRAVPAAEWPVLPSPVEDSLETKRVADELTAAAQVICLGQGVSPALVTSHAQVTGLTRRILRGEAVGQHPLMRGWIGECLGKHLAELAAGRLRLTVRMEGRELRAGFAEEIGD